MAQPKSFSVSVEQSKKVRLEREIEIEERLLISKTLPFPPTRVMCSNEELDAVKEEGLERLNKGKLVVDMGECDI